MLTSTIIGLVVMALFQPRTWCSFCPMGTMTQTICKLKARERLCVLSYKDMNKDTPEAPLPGRGM